MGCKEVEIHHDTTRSIPEDTRSLHGWKSPLDSHVFSPGAVFKLAVEMQKMTMSEYARSCCKSAEASAREERFCVCICESGRLNALCSVQRMRMVGLCPC